MTLEIQYRESDYVSAQIAWLLKHPLALIRGFWYPVTILVVVIIALFNHPEHLRNGLIGALIAVGIIAFSLLVTRWRWHRLFARTPWMHDRVSVTIDGQGIKLKGQSFEATDYWGGISDICETGSVFMFVKPNNGLIFVPKRDMTSLQLNEIRDMIVSNARGKVKMAASSTQV